MARYRGNSDVPAREPVDTALAVGASAVVAATVLLLLWPPTAVYWGRVAAVVGETPTLASVVVTAAGAGAWFARTSGFALLPVILGTGAAYATGMLGIAVWLAPGSPSHFLWYGLLAGAMVCGALLWWVSGQQSR
jgi:hypothetical protein